eukprot:7926763-Heterocapsa_arctica.AAC.1
MLDAPAAPRSAAQTRHRPTDEDEGPAAHKKIKGQQPTSIASTGTTEWIGPTTQEGHRPTPLPLS